MYKAIDISYVYFETGKNHRTGHLCWQCGYCTYSDKEMFDKEKRGITVYFCDSKCHSRWSGVDDARLKTFDDHVAENFGDLHNASKCIKRTKLGLQYDQSPLVFQKMEQDTRALQQDLQEMRKEMEEQRLLIQKLKEGYEKDAEESAKELDRCNPTISFGNY